MNIKDKKELNLRRQKLKRFKQTEIRKLVLSHNFKKSMGMEDDTQPSTKAN